MNKLKNYLPQLRWNSGKGKKGKKSLAQASLSLEPPEVAGEIENVSVLRSSISLDPDILPFNAMEEILSQANSDSSPTKNIERLEIPSEEHVSPDIQCSTPGLNQSCDDHVIQATDQNCSMSTSYVEMQGFLPTSPPPHQTFPRVPPATDSLQAPLVIPAPCNKLRQTTDGYIPLDTCSSGKRIGSFKLEQEERRVYLLNVLSTPPSEQSELRPSLPTKNLYFLESVPPTPSHLLQGRLPGPPLPTKSNGITPTSSRRKVYNIHSVAYGNDATSSSSQAWNSGSNRRDLRNFHHNSFHCFSDNCYPSLRTHELSTFGEYVECDSSNNNNNNYINHNNINNDHDFSYQDSLDISDEKGYYNNAVSSLHRHKERRNHSNTSLVGMDNKDLLRRPVPPPRSTFTRYHSYANEPRSNSFKRNPLEKIKVSTDSYSSSLGRQFERKDFDSEIRDPLMHQKNAGKTSVPKKHRGGFSDDADSLDGSSNYSNEDACSTSDFVLSDESFNPRFATKSRLISRNIHEGKSRPNLEIKYLQLNLEQTPEEITMMTSCIKTEPEHVSNYREIDWLKTKALQETMHARTRVKGN